MIYETYTCSMRDGTLEYGYTFKESAEDDDTEFDLVLGSIKPDSDCQERMNIVWKQMEWAAIAIICAAEQPKA